MTKEIIIQYIPQEIRVAFRENGRLTDISIERPNFRNPVGNIYKGRVLKVLPGMEAAFVDIGTGKAAFLFVDDARPLREIEQYIEKRDRASVETREFQFKIPQKTPTKPPFEPEQASHQLSKLRISDLLTEGQELMVQVFKAPISTKGARVLCNASIPGRNLVFLPYMPGLSFSKQISNESAKNRIRGILQKVLPKDHGLIVRTAGMETTEATFHAEVHYLLDLWQDIQTHYQTLPSPSLLFEEPNIIYRIMRDNLGPQVERIIIDDLEQYEKLKDFFQKYMPDFLSKLQFYNERMNVFDYYNITHELNLALGRKVPLKSGGYLIVDQAEALTAIDVNTGKFIGEGTHEETILYTNMEAVSEIVNQIKLRDIGGIIVLDFIDMAKSEHRQQVYNALKVEMKQDKARSRILTISEMGLVEMTRQRTQENLNKLVSDACPHCNGSGRIHSSETVFFNICRDLYGYKRHSALPEKVSIQVHPDVLDYIEYENREAFEALKSKLQTQISLVSNRIFHEEQYQFLQKETIIN